MVVKQNKLLLLLFHSDYCNIIIIIIILLCVCLCNSIQMEFCSFLLLLLLFLPLPIPWLSWPEGEVLPYTDCGVIVFWLNWLFILVILLLGGDQFWLVVIPTWQWTMNITCDLPGRFVLLGDRHPTSVAPETRYDIIIIEGEEFYIIIVQSQGVRIPSDSIILVVVTGR